MKKTVITFAVILLCTAMAPSQAASGGPSANFSLNFGIMADDSFKFDPFFWYTGATLDIHFGDYVMLSPEVNLMTYQFKFDAFFIEPGVLLNIKAGSMFFGGGVTKPILFIGEETEDLDFFLKLNAGFIGETGLRLRFFASMLFDSLFKNMLIGAQIGFQF